MTATFELISSQTLSTATSSIIFNSIPQTFTDLFLTGAAGTTNQCNTWIRFNGDSSANYSATMLRGDGSSVISSRRTNETAWLQDFVRNSSVVSDIWRVSVFSYRNTSIFKTSLSGFGSSQWEIIPSVGLWRSTSAITSITLYSDTSTFTSGSVFNLYGIRAE